MTSARPRRRRSEKLTPQEFRDLKKYVKSFDTYLDAIEAIGITKPTLSVVLIRGTAAPKTCAKIRKVLAEKDK